MNSLEHLGILYLPTCVGLRYGQYNHKFSGFSRRSAPRLRFTRRIHSFTLFHSVYGFAYRPREGLHAHYQQSRSKLGPRPHITDYTGNGISTVCPSPTSFDLGLGPAKLQRTSLPEEPLGFRWRGFSPLLALLMSASSLACSPPLLTLWLRSACNAPLPLLLREVRRFGGWLEPPYIIGAERHSTSKLLRTL